uniref:Retrotransposon protein, putative, unclassified n=1 Tax=Oryza sativa subsp. japonica TaxID=39947 RepID=Q2QRA1_ORYSJ|nr:retrotransposon protein, putative, unclassified [Oryza sativa Japonica Group]
MAEERESFESQWAPSDVTEENLKEMVAHGVLPAKEIIGWRPAFGEAFPTPDTHEVVVFSHFFYGGFSLPTSRFFRGILNFYGISLHHLNPNSIVHIANFIHAYEAFLGIRPHFALFRRIFFLKPRLNKSKPCPSKLRETLSQKYFSMPFKTSNKSWHANWFYVQNPEPAHPEYSCLPPVYQDTWNSLPMGDEAAQALELMDLLDKAKGARSARRTDHPAFHQEPVMKERMYKIFSNAIVVSYSHLLPVVLYNAFNPPPPEFALMKSDTPIAQRRSPRRQTGQGSGGPKIRADTQPNTSNPAGQSDSRKRKLVLSDDEGDDAGKLGDKGATGKLPKQANPKKKTSSRPMPKIRKSSRKPSDIDPSGKDSNPTNTETGSSKETGSTAKDHESDNQPATDNVEPSNKPPTGNQSAEAGIGVDQEPPTGNQSDTWLSQEIPEVEAQADSPPGKDASNDPGSRSPVKSQEPTRPRPEIIIGPMIGDEEEILRIRAAEDSRPPILVKWWDEDMQPQGIVTNKQKEDEEVCLLKKALSQATRIVNRIQTLETDKAELGKQRDSALKDVEDRKIKSQAEFDVLVGKIKRLEGARDEVANAATPLVQAMFFNNNGPSTFDASEIFDKLRVAPDTYFKNIKEAGSVGVSLALAMTKSLYPKIDIDAIDGFADGMSEEAALDLINDAQKAAVKIAVDVVERFQDTNLRPTGPDNSDDEKTDTD